MALKKSVRSKKSPPVNTTRQASKPARGTEWVNMWSIGAVIGLLTMGMLVVAGAGVSRRANTKMTAQPGEATEQASVATTSAVSPVRPAVEKAVDNAPVTEPAVKVAGAKVTEAKVTPVTITGCLERADEAFRLKDTMGTDAPRARSWKTGFLRKGSVSIDVVDSANRLNLVNHVGHRVSVTGTLVDREMQVRSLRQVATSCTASPKVKI
jgi:hypothetical protein